MKNLMLPKNEQKGRILLIRTLMYTALFLGIKPQGQSSIAQTITRVKML